MFPGLQSGHLLSSIKSRCQCCGRELIDPHDVPEELLAHGVQVRILDISQNNPELVLKELPVNDISKKNQRCFIKYSFQFSPLAGDSKSYLSGLPRLRINV